MRFGRVVVGSAVAHGALLAALARLVGRSAPQPAPVPALIEVTIVPPTRPTELEVAILLDEATPPPNSGMNVHSLIRGTRLAVTTGSSTSDTAPNYGMNVHSVIQAVPDHHGVGGLRMRGVELRPSAATLAQIAERGEPSQKLRESRRLEPAPGGRGVIHDRVTDVTVDRDGAAHFHDKPDIDIHWQLPLPPSFGEARRELGEMVSEWYADPEAGTRFGRFQDLPRHLQAVPGACDDYASAWCDDPLAPDAERKAADRAAIRSPAAAPISRRT